MVNLNVNCRPYIITTVRRSLYTDFGSAVLAHARGLRIASDYGAFPPEFGLPADTGTFIGVRVFSHKACHPSFIRSC